MLQRLPENARVAVIRLRSLGDCVLTTPALTLLKQARPDVEIAVAVEPRFAAIFEGNPSVARILNPSMLEMAEYRPDLCLNFHGGTRSMWMTAASMAGLRAGFAHHRGSWLYNHPIPRAQQILGVDHTVHTAEHLASAIFFLGAPVSEVPGASLYAEPPPASAPYAVIHPVAATPQKTWPAAGFREVARHLQEDHSLDVVFIAGPGDDLSAFHEFRTITGTHLGQTKSLLRGASLFIGNDSGPAHMAAAFRVPVVVLFGPSDPVVWAPWRTTHQVLADRTDIGRIAASSVMAAADHVMVNA